MSSHQKHPEQHELASFSGPTKPVPITPAVTPVDTALWSKEHTSSLGPWGDVDGKKHSNQLALWQKIFLGQTEASEILWTLNIS